MIYKNSWKEKCERNKEWHDWFAWYPVTLDDGRRAWLQTIKRRWNFVPGMMGHEDEYRVEE